MSLKGKSNLYIIAGPNGAGKTTFAREFLPKFAQCAEFINADLIAQGLSPFSPQRSALKAGKLLLEQIDTLTRSKKDFAFETTLSGRTYLNLLKNLRKRDYVIHLFFLWIPKINLALERIKTRVELGGHDVPEKDVRRRFQRGVVNLFQLYNPVLDSWIIFDNSTEHPTIIAKREKSKITIFNKEIYDVIRGRAGV